MNLLSSNDEYWGIYSTLINESPAFLENLEYFKNLLKNTRFEGAIADLRPNRVTKSHATYFESINNFEQFLNIVYQVRCNLFHGNKSPKKDDDLEIIKTIFSLFSEFLTVIYAKEGYI